MNEFVDRDVISARTAIVHDWFQGFHGSERVVDAMRTGLFASDNQPDIFTFHAAAAVLPPDLERAIVKESRLAALPGIRQRGHDPGRWRYLLPYIPYYFRHLPLDEYDLVISSSHALAAPVRPLHDALLVCYCPAPMRYAWLPTTADRKLGGPAGVAFRALAGWLRRLDLEAAQRPDSYVANSEAVRERIERFYGREAVVIHPPVDVDEFDAGRAKAAGNFLWVHRLVRYKRPDVVVEAFRGLPYRLTMVGVGPMEGELRARLPENVDLRGWVGRDELVRLYAESSGFIHVGEEDFGISLVEALASGTPVVALDRGGARDIVRSGTDGFLIERPDPQLLRSAVEEVARTHWDPRALADRAREFSRERFVERFLAHVRGLRSDI